MNLVNASQSTSSKKRIEHPAFFQSETMLTPMGYGYGTVRGRHRLFIRKNVGPTAQLFKVEFDGLGRRIELNFGQCIINLIDLIINCIQCT